MKIKSLQLFTLFIILVLTGCGRKDDDLDAFMKDANNSLNKQIEPLPQVKAFVPMEYNLDGQLNDPFKARKLNALDVNQPDLNKSKEPLESFAVDALKFKGVLSKSKKTYALIQTPDGNLYQVTVGNYIGQNFGMITAIKENKDTAKYEILYREKTKDSATGDWAEHLSTMELQED